MFQGCEAAEEGLWPRDRGMVKGRSSVIGYEKKEHYCIFGEYLPTADSIVG